MGRFIGFDFHAVKGDTGATVYGAASVAKMSPDQEGAARGHRELQDAKATDSIDGELVV